MDPGEIVYAAIYQPIGCMTQEGFEKYMAAQAANRPSIDPVAALLLLQGMQPRQSYQPLPVPQISAPPAPRMQNCTTNFIGRECLHELLLSQAPQSGGLLFRLLYGLMVCW